MRSSFHFDFVECSAQAYRFVWDNRGRILQMSALLLAVKILSFVSFVVFEMQAEGLLQGLLSLPMYAFEGVVIARIMVMALYESEAVQNSSGRLVLPPSGDIERNIKASMIIYVLGKLCLSFLVGMSMEGTAGMSPETAPDPSAQALIAVILTLGFVVWAFRFLWLYVPMVMGRQPLDFLRNFRWLPMSLTLIAVWILCFMPLLFGMVVVSEFFGMILTSFGVAVDSMMIDGMLAAVQGVFDTLMSMVASLAVAYGIFSIYRGDNKKVSLF